MNELDQFVKHQLRVKYYFRHADDFVIVHSDDTHLQGPTCSIQRFLKDDLDLGLHPKKIVIRRLHQGIDFLGYVILPHHIVLRTKTKRRTFRKLFEKRGMLERDKISFESYNQSIQSYLGMLEHSNGYNLSNIIQNNFSGAGFPLPRE
ncbi:MAG: hypothetical protein HY396_01565 [Candidatus Doudnabacteria bacterium]|nr:hypothetical protein [Candidatus Doudnabacteria bacterium]